MEKNIRKNNGITLVALVITVIILLILAGVAISALTQTGLFKNAKQAKDRTIEKQQEEEEILSSYEEGIESKGYIVSDRSEAWKGATMLTINISNITGGTFRINVNNTEANNYGKLYYYINNKLVYSGTESSYEVTEFDGQPITDNTVYKVKVLAEPFDISVTTGEGDNVSTWLACIGNSNKEGYTINNLTELFNNETLMNNLLANESAVEYLAKSTEKILPEFLKSEAITRTCSNSEIFEKICNNSEVFGKLIEYQEFRESMYNNAQITEGILDKSDIAINTMKTSSKYMTKVYSNGTVNKKAFIVKTKQDAYNWDEIVGNFLIGKQKITYSKIGNATGYHSVKKFVSSIYLGAGCNPDHTIEYLEI